MNQYYLEKRESDVTLSRMMHARRSVEREEKSLESRLLQLRNEQIRNLKRVDETQKKVEEIYTRKKNSYDMRAMVHPHKRLAE